MAKSEWEGMLQSTIDMHMKLHANEILNNRALFKKLQQQGSLFGRKPLPETLGPLELAALAAELTATGRPRAAQVLTLLLDAEAVLAELSAALGAGYAEPVNQALNKLFAVVAHGKHSFGDGGEDA